jgi:hypothetical protein
MSMRVRVWRDGHEVDAPVRGKREKKVLIDPLGTQIQRETRQRQREQRDQEKQITSPEFYAVSGRSRAKMVSGGLPSLGKKAR